MALVLSPPSATALAIMRQPSIFPGDMGVYGELRCYRGDKKCKSGICLFAKAKQRYQPELRDVVANLQSGP
jgi:hypothetical protein